MLRRISVILAIILMATALTVSTAYADRIARQEGPNGVASAVINLDGQNYRVDYAATDYSSDNLFTVTTLTVIDQAGSRTFRNTNRGGDISDFETFANRGDVTVSIVFSFTRAFGENENNSANPLVVTYP